MNGESEARERITIVLADDHEIVRNGIKLVLEAQPDMEVVAEAADAEAAVRYVLGHKPSVLVLDLSMPGSPAWSRSRKRGTRLRRRPWSC